jgi:hypothetical protein
MLNTLRTIVMGPERPSKQRVNTGSRARAQQYLRNSLSSLILRIGLAGRIPANVERPVLTRIIRSRAAEKSRKIRRCRITSSAVCGGAGEANRLPGHIAGVYPRSLFVNIIEEVAARVLGLGAEGNCEAARITAQSLGPEAPLNCPWPCDPGPRIVREVSIGAR